jgi:hypothetical protein
VNEKILAPFMNGKKEGWLFVKKTLRSNTRAFLNHILNKIIKEVIKGLIWKSGFKKEKFYSGRP